MATEPKPASNIQRQRHRASTLPSARARSARELDRTNPANKKRITRMDPAQAQRIRSVQLAREDYNAPMPQNGMSSSELNTAHPAMKTIATRESADWPTNIHPEGEMTAGDLHERTLAEQRKAAEAAKEERAGMLAAYPY